MAKKISFDERLLHTPVGKNDKWLRVYLYLKSKMAKEDKQEEVCAGRRTILIPLKKGQLVSLRNQDANKLGISPSTYRNILLKLERTTIMDNQKDNQNSVVTIHEERYLETLENKSVQKKGQPLRTTKNVAPKAVELAGLLADLILDNNPGNTSLNNGKRDASIQSWADPIEKLYRIDGQSWENIELVIRWCQKDSFWHVNILSGGKLREKFDKLMLKAGASVGIRKKDKESDSYVKF